jgi:hypothetical protein
MAKVGLEGKLPEIVTVFVRVFALQRAGQTDEILVLRSAP